MTTFAFWSASAAADLPPFHANPSYRAPVALAQRSGRTVLTSDAMVGRYGVPVRGEGRGQGSREAVRRTIS